MLLSLADCSICVLCFPSDCVIFCELSCLALVALFSVPGRKYQCLAEGSFPAADAAPHYPTRRGLEGRVCSKEPSQGSLPHTLHHHQHRGVSAGRPCPSMLYPTATLHAPPKNGPDPQQVRHDAARNNLCQLGTRTRKREPQKRGAATAVPKNPDKKEPQKR